MKQIEKLKLKRKFLTSAISLSTLLCMMPISNKEVYASEISYENTTDESIFYDIYYYCLVYNLKQEIVIDILKNKTYNFTDAGWNQYNMIEYKMYDSKELAILTTIRNIYDNPKNYGYEKDAITANYNYQSMSSPEAMVEKYASIYNIPSEIVLAIMYAECGKDMNSHNYLVNNNPAGLGPHMHFDNKEIGIIYFINLLKDKYGCDINSTNEFFNQIARTYCENPDHWINMTNSHYNDILNKKMLIK